MTAHALMEGAVDEKPMGERVQAVETWKENHEDRCDARQNDMKKAIETQGKLVLGMMVALLAWALVEVYRLQTNRMAPAPQAAAPMIIYAPPGTAPVVVNPVQNQAQPQLPAPPSP